MTNIGNRKEARFLFKYLCFLLIAGTAGLYSCKPSEPFYKNREYIYMATYVERRNNSGFDLDIRNSILCHRLKVVENSFYWEEAIAKNEEANRDQLNFKLTDEYLVFSRFNSKRDNVVTIGVFLQEPTCLEISKDFKELNSVAKEELKKVVREDFDRLFDDAIDYIDSSKEQKLEPHQQ